MARSENTYPPYRKDTGVKAIALRKAVTASITAITFLTTSLAGAPDSLAAVQAAQSAVSEVSTPYQTKLDPGIRFSVPQELGTLQYFKPGKGPMVVHLQTAHGHYQAQKQIQALLHHLDKQYGIKTLFVEGSAFKLDPGILDFFPGNPKLTEKANDALTKAALVKGPELYLLDTQGTSRAYGIEDLNAYRENGVAFVDVLAEKKKTASFLAAMDEAIDRITAAHLNDALRNYLKQLGDFEKGRIPFDAWLASLKREGLKRLRLDLAQPGSQLDWPMLVRVFKVQELSAKLDTKAFPAEREKFLEVLRRCHVSSYAQIEPLLKSGQMSRQLPALEIGLLFEDMVRALPRDFHYEAFPNVCRFIGRLLLQSEITAPELMREIERLSAKIMDKLAGSPEGKDLVALLKDYRLLERLFALELTPEAYEQIRSRGENGLRPSVIIKRLQHVGRVKDVRFTHIAELDQLFVYAMKFYAGVKERDGLMERMIEKRLHETGAGKVAVITGGFHAGPFRDYFSSKDYTYALITPRLTGGDGAGHQSYEENMLKFAQGATVKGTAKSGMPGASEATRELEFLTDPQVLSGGTYGINAAAVRSEVRKIVEGVAGRAEVREIPAEENPPTPKAGEGVRLSQDNEQSLNEIRDTFVHTVGAMKEGSNGELNSFAKGLVKGFHNASFGTFVSLDMIRGKNGVIDSLFMQSLDLMAADFSSSVRLIDLFLNESPEISAEFDAALTEANKENYSGTSGELSRLFRDEEQGALLRGSHRAQVLEMRDLLAASETKTQNLIRNLSARSEVRETVDGGEVRAQEKTALMLSPENERTMEDLRNPLLLFVGEMGELANGALVPFANSLVWGFHNTTLGAFLVFEVVKTMGLGIDRQFMQMFDAVAAELGQGVRLLDLLLRESPEMSPEFDAALKEAEKESFYGVPGELSRLFRNADQRALLGGIHRGQVQEVRDLLAAAGTKLQGVTRDLSERSEVRKTDSSRETSLKNAPALVLYPALSRSELRAAGKRSNLWAKIRLSMILGAIIVGLIVIPRLNRAGLGSKVVVNVDERYLRNGSDPLAEAFSPSDWAGGAQKVYVGDYTQTLRHKGISIQLKKPYHYSELDFVVKNETKSPVKVSQYGIFAYDAEGKSVVYFSETPNQTLGAGQTNDVTLYQGFVMPGLVQSMSGVPHGVAIFVQREDGKSAIFIFLGLQQQFQNEMDRLGKQGKPRSEVRTSKFLEVAAGMYKNVWLARFQKALSLKTESNDDIEKLIELAGDDFYWVRIAALSQLANVPDARIKVVIRRFSGKDTARDEVAMILQAYRQTSKRDILNLMSEAKVMEGGDAAASKEQIDASVSKREDFLGMGKEVLMARWDSRNVRRDAQGLLEATKTRKRTQQVRAIVIWQMVADMALFIENATGKQDDPAAAMNYIIDRKIMPMLAREIAPPMLTAVQSQNERSWLRVVSKASKFSPYLDGGKTHATGAVVVSETGEIIGVGYNGAPSGQLSDTVVMGVDIRRNGLMENDKNYTDTHEEGKLALDIRDNRPDLRRSICAEQRAIFMALSSGKNLKGATLYATHSPCNQCALTAFNAGIRRISYGEGFHDQNTEQIINLVRKNGEIFSVTPISGARSEVRERLNAVFRAFKIDESSGETRLEKTKNLADRVYIEYMTRQHLNPKSADAAADKNSAYAPLHIRGAKGSLSEVSDKGNAVVTAMLEDKEMQEVGVYQRSDLENSLRRQEYLTAASQASLIWNTLDGGIGESLMREAWLLNKGLRMRLKNILSAGDDAEPVYREALIVLRDAEKRGETADILAALRKLEGLAGFTVPLQVKMGAKGTDFGRQERIRGNDYLIGDAEARLLFMADLAQSGQFGKVVFQPLVNYQSKASYEKLLDEKLYVWDIVEGRPQPRTYREALKDAGVGFLAMVEQRDLPKFEVEPGEVKGFPTADVTVASKAQPGGHGQLGVYFVVDFTENAPPKDKLHHLRFFGNGDNRKGNPEALVAGFAIVERKPILKITTAATAIDKKGGKEVVRIIQKIIDGVKKVFTVLDQWEEIDAVNAGQEKIFYAAGQRQGFGKEGRQLFNTNLFYFNIDMLHPILNEMRGIVGQDEFLDGIMPFLFDKSAKAQTIDGKKYVSMDSAIGYVVHKLNTFYTTDPRFESLRQVYGPQLLYYMNYDRDIFAPKKNAGDQYLQEGTDHYTAFDESIKNFYYQGFTPPGFDLTDPYEKDGKTADSKFWVEAQHWLDSLGFSRVRQMTSLKIEGRVTLHNAEFIGDVEIINRFGRQNTAQPAQRVDLSGGRYLDQLKARGFWNTDHLRLENIRITIDEAGNLMTTAISTIRTQEGALRIRNTENAKWLLEDLRTQGASVLMGRGFEIKNGGELDILPGDFRQGVDFFVEPHVVIDGATVSLRLGGQNHVVVDSGTVFQGPPGLKLDLTMKEGDWLHIKKGVLQNVIKSLEEQETPDGGGAASVVASYMEHLKFEELGKAFYIRKIVDSLVAYPLEDNRILANAQWVKSRIDEFESTRFSARSESRTSDFQDMLTPEKITLIKYFYFSILPAQLLGLAGIAGGREAVLETLRRATGITVDGVAAELPESNALGELFSPEASLSIPETIGRGLSVAKAATPAVANLGGKVFLGQDALSRLMGENPRALFYLLKAYAVFADQNEPPVLLTLGSPDLLKRIELSLVNKDSSLTGFEIVERGTLLKFLKEGKILQVIEPVAGKSEAQVINELAATTQGGIASLHLGVGDRKSVV